MASQTDAPLLDDDIDWEDHTTPKGVAYQVGFSKAGPGDAAAAVEATGDKKNFGIGVSWPPTGGTWVQTPSIVRSRAAITQYSLGPNSGIWKYILYFTNTEHYNYYFYDETGDYYQVNTFRNGNHYVRYNSDEPDIVYITGS